MKKTILIEFDADAYSTELELSLGLTADFGHFVRNNREELLRQMEVPCAGVSYHLTFPVKREN